MEHRCYHSTALHCGMNSVYPSSGDYNTVSQPDTANLLSFLLFGTDQFYMHSNLCECRSLRFHHTCTFVWAPQSVAELPHHQASLWLPTHSPTPPPPSPPPLIPILQQPSICSHFETVKKMESYSTTFESVSFFFHLLWIPWDPSQLFQVSTVIFSPLSRVSLGGLYQLV